MRSQLLELAYASAVARLALGALLLVGPAHVAIVTELACARSGQGGQERLLEGRADGLRDDVCCLARVLVERNLDLAEAAGRRAVVESARLHLDFRKQLLDGERVQHRLQRLSAVDHLAAPDALLASLVIGHTRATVRAALDQVDRAAQRDAAIERDRGGYRARIATALRGQAEGE